ncbi:MAG: septal ring lytic transglycosylase RlpA family protein [Methylococcales bacterium]|nr:septal ring lytic transglycosylase RlpA family protein [Methylococcales bacterium]
MFAICTLLVRSSEQQKQMIHERESAETIPVYKETGKASWYGPGFQGQETASGETFDTNKMTAASPNLPLGTKVEVTNLEKNKKVEVEINDRGPYAKGRVIDLSGAAAKKLGMVKKGTVKVKVVAKVHKKKPPKKKFSKNGSEVHR